MAGGRYSAVGCQTSERDLKGFCAGNSITQTLSLCCQGPCGEESGYQSTGASFRHCTALVGLSPGSLVLQAAARASLCTWRRMIREKCTGPWGCGQEASPKVCSRNAIQLWEVGTPSSGVVLLQEPLPCPSHSGPSPLAVLCTSPCPGSCNDLPQPRRETPRPCAEGCGHTPGHRGAGPVVEAIRFLSHCLVLPPGNSPSQLPKVAETHAVSLPILQILSPSSQKRGSRFFSQMAPAATLVPIWSCFWPSPSWALHSHPSLAAGSLGKSSALGPDTWWGRA